MCTAEDTEKYAQVLMTHADTLGKILIDCTDMIRDGAAAFTLEKESTDVLYEQLPQLQRALNTIAMRLDRAALAKHI